jgi:cell wall-associated NlpC family hydrolase
MPNRRAPALAYVLAVPVVLAVYAGTFGTRLWLALRPAVATFLGATVIGSVYADEALKRAPATPMRAAAVLALAVALVGTGMAPAPAFAGSDPVDKVIAAARSYLGTPYKLGAEGPDKFDCSGLVYRIFADAGELPRVGGMRLLARGYMRWFVSRGLFTKDIDKAKRGDLVVWGMGEHIGIYVGDNKAISAVLNPWGVTLHGVNWVPLRADYFLQVDYGNGNGNGNEDPGDGNGDGDGDGNDNPGDGEPGDGNGDDPGAGPGDPPPGDGEGNNPTDPPPGDSDPPPGDGGDGEPAEGSDDKGSSENGVGKNANEYGPPAPPTDEPPSDPPPDNPEDPGKDGNGQPEPENPAPDSAKGVAKGTMNLRESPDPSARIVGWISRGTTFRIVGSGNSASGYRWYKIETTSGRQGWLFGHWVREL